MNNTTVKVLRLGGCGWCETVCEELDKAGIKYQAIDANVENDLADRAEDLLDTNLYPIVIVDRPIDTWYVFRPTNEKEVDRITPLEFKNFKMGCNTIADIVKNVVKLAK